MKIVFEGTDHTKEEDAIAVTLTYEEGDDTWTFDAPGISFTISDLTKALEFLKEEK